MFNFVNKTDKAEVYLYGTIGPDFWGEGNSASAFAKELDGLGGKPVDIHIDSGGGDVFDGFAMASAIQRYPGKTTAYVEGLAASAASYVAVVCDHVVMNDYAWMMIHRASTCCWGNVADLETTAERLRGIDATLAQIYAQRTSLSEEEAMDAMVSETWYGAQEAKDLNFCQEITETEERMAACLDPELENRYRNIPEGIYVRGELNASDLGGTVPGSVGAIQDPVASHAEDNLEETEAPADDAGYFVIDGRVYKEENKNEL